MPEPAATSASEATSTTGTFSLGGDELRPMPRLQHNVAFITGSDFLMDGGVTASYFYGELARQDHQAS